MVINDEFNVTPKNFTDVNDQLNYFVKTLNIAKKSFISRKRNFINSGNYINLSKIAKFKEKAKIIETVPQNKGH